MNIKGMNKAEILAALYNRSRPQGFGFLQADSTPMTTAQAQKILDGTPGKYFDYLMGRVMKIDLSGDELDTSLYNRDIGKGAAERVIEDLQLKAIS